VPSLNGIENGRNINGGWDFGDNFKLRTQGDF
jgi:hypothetical protein